MENNPVKKNITIAVFSETPMFDIPISILDGIQKICRRENANMLYICSKAVRSPIKHHIRSNILYDLLDSRKFDGIILVSNLIGAYIANSEYQEFCNKIKSKNVISLAELIDGVTSVIVNNKKGVYDITKHLIEKHKISRIAFIKGPEGNQDSDERYAGFLQAMEEAGLEIDYELVINGNFQQQSGIAAVDKLINQYKKTPGMDFQAIIAVNDYMAFGALQQLNEYGIKVPEQVAVCGFDDVDIAKQTEPTLTTVRQSFKGAGETAAEIILDKINGIRTKNITKIDCEPVYRETCGCPKSDEIDSDVTREITIIRYFNDETAKQVLLPDLKRLFTETYATDSRTTLYMWSHAINLLQNPDYWPGKQFIKPDSDLKDQLWPVMLSTARRSIKILKKQRLYSDMKTALMATHDIGIIMDNLNKYLPHLGIRECYICMYIDPLKTDKMEHLPKKARLLLAFTSESRIDLPHYGLEFDTSELLPDNMLEKSSPFTMVMEDLYFEDDQIGYFIMDTGLENMTYYTELTIQISNTLYGYLLIEREKNLSKKLAAANRKIKRINEKLKENKSSED